LAVLRQIYLGDDSLIKRRLPPKRRAYAKSARFAVERVLELIETLGPPRGLAGHHDLGPWRGAREEEGAGHRPLGARRMEEGAEEGQQG